MKVAKRLVRLAAVLGATLVAACGATTIAPPMRALADCGMQAPPGSISGYRGVAFIGTVARTERVDSAGYGQVSAITYRIERMLAGQPVTSMTVVEGDGGSCWYVDGRRLRVGDRVLISGAAPGERGGGHPFLSHELVWRATGHDTWRFASGMYGIFLDFYPRAARAATTTRAIRALVAPDVDLPDTSTSPVPAASPGPSPGAAVTRLTTCGGHAYPGLGIDAPVGYGSIDEVQALAPALIRFADVFPGSDGWPWRLAGRDETGMLFLARTDAYGPPGWMSVEVTVGSRPGDASMGQCDPRIVTAADVGPADWWLDPDQPAPDAASTELHILVMEQACASGTSAEGRIADPVIDYAADAVTMTIGVHGRAGTFQDCQSNPATPFVVRLSEPLGDRTLLDGGHAVPVPPSPPDLRPTAPTMSSPPPPGDAATGPRAVLERYIAALLAGDCDAASAETAASFRYGSGELCGYLSVTAASIEPGGPAQPSEDEVVFATQVTTVRGDASIPDGTMTWFYQLLREPDGRWLIAGGGSGP